MVLVATSNQGHSIEGHQICKRNEKEHTCQMQKYFPSKWLQGFSVLLMKIREALRAIQGCTIRFRIKRAYK